MKELRIVLAILLFFTAGPVFSQAVEKTPGSTTQETREKEKYRQSMEGRLRKLGKELGELKSKAATMTEQARKDMNRSIAEAEKKHKAASRKLEEMQRETQKKWEDFMSEMDAAFDDLEKSYEKAKSRLRR